VVSVFCTVPPVIIRRGSVVEPEFAKRIVPDVEVMFAEVTVAVSEIVITPAEAFCMVCPVVALTVPPEMFTAPVASFQIAAPVVALTAPPKMFIVPVELFWIARPVVALTVPPEMFIVPVELFWIARPAVVLTVPPETTTAPEEWFIITLVLKDILPEIVPPVATSKVPVPPLRLIIPEVERERVEDISASHLTVTPAGISSVSEEFPLVAVPVTVTMVVFGAGALGVAVKLPVKYVVLLMRSISAVAS